MAKRDWNPLAKALAIWGLLIAAMLGVTLLTGCKSQKQVAKTEVKSEVSVAAKTEVCDTTISVMEEVRAKSDTATTRFDEEGAMEISRDSAGRPVKIVWKRNSQGATASSSKVDAHTILYGESKSKSVETTDSIATDTKVVCKEAPANNTGKALLATLILLLVIYIIYYTWKRWKKM